MSEEGRAVVRRTRGEWQAIMSRFERSGQGRREFCEAEGLVLGTFSWWRTELGRSGAAEPAPATAPTGWWRSGHRRRCGPASATPLCRTGSCACLTPPPV